MTEVVITLCCRFMSSVIMANCFNNLCYMVHTAVYYPVVYYTVVY